MELLRRAILVGCLLPGLWLLRLVPLDPLLTVVPVDFAARQKQEAAAVPDEQKTDAQRRNALLPLPVYVEEFLQYNVFSGAGPEWDRFLGDVDEIESARGARGKLSGRASADLPESEDGSRYLFFRPDEEPIRAVLDKVAAGLGTTYISISRPGRDVHYRVDRRVWTRKDFRPGAGFTGKPAPPPALLYPFRRLGLGSILVGLVLFSLLPGAGRSGAGRGPATLEIVALAAGLLLFAAPLVAVGGSVQALTRGLLWTIPCWLLAAAGAHLFARPGQNAPDRPIAAPEDARQATRAAAEGPPGRALFLREGLAFLAMALGPLAFLIASSMTLWNR
jgi:hypothetical protein